MQEIPTAPSAPTTPTLSGMGSLGPLEDQPVKPSSSLGRISLKKLARNEARLAPAVERVRQQSQAQQTAQEEDLFREDDLDREPLVGAYGSESTIINTDPDGVALDDLGAQVSGIPDATAVHDHDAAGPDVDGLFDEEDDWDDEPTEAFSGVSLDTLANPPVAASPASELASPGPAPDLPELPSRPPQIRRKTTEVGDLPARPDSGPRWGSRSPLPPPPQATAEDLPPRRPNDLPDLPARPRSSSGAFPAAPSPSPPSGGGPDPSDLPSRPFDLPSRPSGKPVDMGFFEQSAPPGLRPIGSVRLDRRTGEVPMEMELGDVSSSPGEHLIEDEIEVIDDDAFEAVPTDPSSISGPPSSAELMAETPTMAGDPLATDQGLAATSSAEMALSASGPGQSMGFGGPMVPSLTQPPSSVPDLPTAPGAPPAPSPSTPTLVPPPPPSAQPTANVEMHQAGAPALVTPLPPDLGEPTATEAPAPPGGALIPPPPPAQPGGALIPPPPPSQPGPAAQPGGALATPPPPDLGGSPAGLAASGLPELDQPGSNGAPSALDALETAGHDALVPLDSAGSLSPPSSASLALPELEDLPPDPLSAASSGPIASIPSASERSDALAAAITSELGDLPEEQLPSGVPFGAPSSAPETLRPATPSVSDDGIMVFVPDAPVAEGGVDEPAPAGGAPKPAASPPPREPIKDQPDASRPLARPQRRVAAGHGIAKRGSQKGGELAAPSGGSSTLRLALLIAIPTALIVAGVVITIVLTR